MKNSEQFVRELLSQVHNNHKELVIALVKEHRTNQQTMMRFCVSFIETMAKNDTDARNEASVNFAKQVVEKIDNRIMPYI